MYGVHKHETPKLSWKHMPAVTDTPPPNWLSMQMNSTVPGSSATSLSKHVYSVQKGCPMATISYELLSVAVATDQASKGIGHGCKHIFYHRIGVNSSDHIRGMEEWPP